MSDRIISGIIYCSILAVLTLSTFLLIGDFGIRLAASPGDDGPVPYARFLQDPQRFEKDAWVMNWSYSAGASMQNWMTGLLFKYAGLSPEIAHFFLVFLQNILFGFAMYRFSLVVTGKRDIALLSVAFVFLSRAYTWNLAGYGDLMHMPYAGHLALPFCLYAVSFALEHRYVAASAVLLMGSLIHPVVGVFTTTMIVAGMIWQNRKALSLSLGVKFSLFFLLLAASVIPSLLSMPGAGEMLNKDALPLILANAHTIPWTNPVYFTGVVQNLVMIVLVVVLVIVSFREKGDYGEFKSFWYVSLTVCAVFCLLHLLFIYLQVGFLLRLILPRATLLLVVFSVPAILGVLLNRINKGGLSARFVVIGFLLLPSLFTALPAAIVSASFVDTRSELASFARRMLRAVGFFFFWLVVVLATASLVVPSAASWWTSKVPLLSQVVVPENGYFFILSLIIALLTGQRSIGAIRRLSPFLRLSPSRFRMRPLPFVPLILVVAAACLFLRQNNVYGKLFATDDSRAYYQAQLWAKNSTTRSSAFIVCQAHWSTSWRTFSDRPFVAPFRVGNYYVYTKKAKAYDEALESFYLKKGVCVPDMIHNSNTEQCFLSLKEQDVSEFASTFGGDYLVEKASNRPLSFPVAYRNGYYVIYRLTPPPGGFAGGRKNG